MPNPPPRSSWLRRNALGLWLCGIGAFGLLRFFMRAFRDAGFAADTVTWLWLIGAIVVSVVGIAMLLAATRRPRR